MSAPNINLLPREGFGEDTPLGRLLIWATTYGRYIMVLTELLVLIAFASRFSLDRKLTDLNEEIAQKQAILEVNSQLESDIRALQSQLAQVKTIINQQTIPVDILNYLQNILPTDMYFKLIDFSNNKLTVTAISGTTESFSQFLNRLTSNKKITKIEINDVKKQTLKGIEFQFTAVISEK